MTDAKVRITFANSLHIKKTNQMPTVAATRSNYKIRTVNVYIQ